ncbi:nucleoporin FG repeat region-domain-containing protein [Mycena filopes]|nr:nucleoporin FG repeat region-domain-containing protein [Mycena filopes]
MAFPTSSAAFGIKSTAPANASVFGQKPPTTGLFGAQPQNNALGGAFGQAQPNNAFGQPQQGGAFGQQQTQGGGAFGQNQPAAGGLFGQPQQNQQPAAGGGLFGQSQQQPAGGGLFGQPQNQQPATGGGLFGAQNQQPAAGGGLFGQSQQQPAAGGGLFGQSQTQTPAAGGGLFGQSQAAPSGGLFGQPQQAAAPTGGLFGQPQTQQPAAGGLFGQSQNQQGGGLFGQSNNQQAGGGLFGASQQPAAPGGGLFGSNPLFGAPKPAAGPSIFGASATNNQQQQPGLFGASNNANPLFNSGANSMFGAKPQQQQALQGSQGPPPFTKSTKFNDLPDAVKRTLEEIDSHIQGRIQISKELHQRKLGDEATKGQETIRAVHKDLINTTTAIRADLHFTRDLKAKTEQTVQDTIVATRLVDGFRNPHANAAYLKDHAGFPLEFFTRVTTQMHERLAWYKSTIEQIERKLSSSTGQAQYTPQGIHATLQAQHATFLALASKTAAVDAQLARIKQVYTQLWRAKTGSHRDPFEGGGDGEGGDLGFWGLNV